MNAYLKSATSTFNNIAKDFDENKRKTGDSVRMKFKIVKTVILAKIYEILIGKVGMMS